MVEFSSDFYTSKEDLLNYFRERAQESLDEIGITYGVNQFKQRSKELNTAINKTEDSLKKTFIQFAKSQEWSSEQTLNSVLLINYTKNIVMLESRNDVWPYEYMAFSRRIGEIWEPFCKLCFDYPVRDISFFIPPLFSEVKRKLSDEIKDYISSLNITNKQKKELLKYYDKVWSLVTSGEIKLELDLHFQVNNEKKNVDFKSGFGSNEKGNTNRLLLVATIYKYLEENYKCILLVRSDEDSNNNYFQTLKNSGVWEAFCGKDSYTEIQQYSGFDINTWISQNIDWESDLKKDTIGYFKNNDLIQYLKW